MVLRKFNITNKELQQKCLNEVIARMQDMESANPGMIVAQDIIDIVTENYGPQIYNMGVRDTKKLLTERFADIETEIDILEQA